MLVKCPECEARYEIDGTLIPTEGRRVQCTACNHVWQQEPGAADADATTPGAGEELPRERPPLAEEVRSILREEAERESRVRRERGLVEIPPDRSPPSGAGAGHHRLRASSGPFPDADAINATLRAASERAAETQRGGRRPGRGGFAAGLLVGLVLIALAAAAYVTAPRIAEAVPQAAPALDRYVVLVDDLRVTLDRTAERAADAVAGLLPADG